MTSSRLRYDWNDVVYFLELARQRNLMRAAAKLKVDHTTVGRRIRELERSLGRPLFTRSKLGFVLTEEGSRLLQYAEGMENQANLMAEAIGGDAQGGGAVRIASLEGIGSFYLTPLIAEFSREHPSIQIELITDTRILDLSRREADVFVSFFNPRGRRLQTQKIGEFRVSLYASPSYFANRPMPRSLVDLEELDFIDFIDEHVQIRENLWLSDLVRPSSIVFRSTSLMAQYMSAVAGQGLVMLPSFVAARDNALIPVLPDAYCVRDIWISVHEDILHLSRIRAVQRFFTNRIAVDLPMSA